MSGPRLALSVASAISMALVGQGLEAAAAPPGGLPAASPIPNDPGKRICREVTPTGTRFAKRVCKTPDEWQKDTDDAQRHIDDNNRSYREEPCKVGCAK